MTANQIEYWKLQETRRHNVATEQMDAPLKESQTQLNYEYIATAPTQRALNIAQERAAIASEAAGYATAAERYAAADLNVARAVTEQTQQSLNASKALNVDASTYAMWESMPSNTLQGVLSKAQLGVLDFNTKGKELYGKAKLISDATGNNIFDMAYTAAKTYSLFN